MRDCAGRTFTDADCDAESGPATTCTQYVALYKGDGNCDVGRISLNCPVFGCDGTDCSSISLPCGSRSDAFVVTRV